MQHRLVLSAIQLSSALRHMTTVGGNDNGDGGSGDVRYRGDGGNGFALVFFLLLLFLFLSFLLLIQSTTQFLYYFIQSRHVRLSSSILLRMARSTNPSCINCLSDRDPDTKQPKVCMSMEPGTKCGWCHRAGQGLCVTLFHPNTRQDLQLRPQY